MASTNGHLSDFILTPQQQSLLFAALNSNKQSSTPPVNGNLNMSPPSLDGSPVQKMDANGFQESPFIDYDYDFNGDTSFDFAFADGTQPKMIGDLPGSGSASSSKSGSDNDGENTEKRSHPDDDEDDDGGDAKRQETGEKVPKKPGRKPLTTEPTSKRKAQNRAAQRAFRERKEQHLKNLETKVEELEKASASTNHENSVLRSQVEKMTAELGEYKKKFSALMMNNRNPNLSGPRPTFGNPIINNLNDVNFQFEFPKFGRLPGPSPSTTNGISTNGRTSNTSSPHTHRSPSVGTNSSQQKAARQGSNGSNPPKGMDAQTKEDLAKFSGIFSPPLTNNNVASASRTSTDSHNSGAPTMTSSPSASSHSNGGPSSSCGTSPEPCNQSPMGFKPVDTLTTIGEEKQPSFANTNQDYGHFANIDMNDLNFLASTNNFQFDPQLFGGYREPQDNILGTGIDDSFFNDAFEMDFTTPYFAPSPGTQKDAHKKEAHQEGDLMARIDAAKNEDTTELVQTNDGQLLTCNKIWEKLQDCPRVQSGDFDLDGLCSDLQKKARCSGSGAVVDESTFKNVMQKYLGKTDEEMAAGYCTGDLHTEKVAQQTSS